MSEEAEVFEKSLKLIIQARQLAVRSDQVRQFNLPDMHDFNLNANHFIDLLKWESLSKKVFTPPPLLDRYTNDQLKSLKREDFPRLLCHSHSNERNVQIVTKVAKKSIGVKKIKGSVFCTIQSQEELPYTSTKEDFLKK